MDYYDLSEFANQYGLDIVETTSERSGYPRNLKYALVGFDTFEECKSFCDKYGFHPVHLEKRDGWQLWYRGNTAYEPYSLSEEDFGYSDGYTRDQAEDFLDIRENMKEEALDDLQITEFEYDTHTREIYNKIKSLDSNHMLLLSGDYEDGRYEIEKIKTMGYYYDTHHYLIGAMPDD